MQRANRLRNRLILVFFAATLLPLAATLWITLGLIDRSLRLAPTAELDEVSTSLQKVGREYYQQAREALKAEVVAGRIAGRKLPPEQAVEVESDRFALAGDKGDQLEYYVRRGSDVFLYSRKLDVGMNEISAQFRRARDVLDGANRRDLRRGFALTFVLVTGAFWLAAFIALLYWTQRLSKPVHELTQGLEAVAAGDLAARVETDRDDELGSAIQAFNHMAGQLQQARERLIHVTRVASWQAVARKMAHEVKNSLTPIRLTMEEVLIRRGDSDRAFLEQAAQIAIDEVNTLERRVKAFSELASEPPVEPSEIDLNAMIEERIALLRGAHPGLIYETQLDTSKPSILADPDLIKGILTNLLENAAHAAGPGGVVRTITAVVGGRVRAEVHDSGPGLSLQARSTLFQPSISFKKGGMGLGLSIAHRSAMLCGGELSAIPSELGGAAFRLQLPVSPRVHSLETEEPVRHTA
jgi:nitrogen fixation/metabolism regulation signal transduction histidine kinase